MKAVSSRWWLENKGLRQSDDSDACECHLAYPCRLSTLDIALTYRGYTEDKIATLQLTPLSNTQSFVHLLPFGNNRCTSHEKNARRTGDCFPPSRNAVSVSPAASKPFSIALKSCQISCWACAQPVAMVNNIQKFSECSSPRVIGTCSGELQGAVTRVESLKCKSSMSFSRWKLATDCTKFS